jgi:hypothetical protein
MPAKELLIGASGGHVGQDFVEFETDDRYEFQVGQRIVVWLWLQTSDSPRIRNTGLQLWNMETYIVAEDGQAIKTDGGRVIYSLPLEQLITNINSILNQQ